MESKKIDISALNNVGLDFEKIHNESFIDLTEKIDKPPIAISIGETNFGQKIEPIPFGTYGNFSCIAGATKSKKTFFKSLVVASYIGGCSTNYAPDFKTHRDKDLTILDFDTEQSKYHAQRTFKRVSRIINGGDINASDYINYKTFGLRKLNYKERLQFIEWCILDKYKDNLGLVVIDGLADLVSEVNDMVSSNELMDKLLKWTDITQCHLIGVLHVNYKSEKPTGNLGSAIMKKGETVCLLDVDENDKRYTNVKFPPTLTRNYPIDGFSFRINEYGLPIIESNTYDMSNNQVPF